MNYDEIRIGMVVNYHSEIGGPITKRNRLVESDPWQIGHGEWVVLLSEIHGAVSLKAISEVKEETRNKEEIYDQDISSLMDAIITTCIENSIPLVAEFSIPIKEAPSLRASTMVAEHMDHIPYHMLKMMQIQQSYKSKPYIPVRK